MRKDNHQSASSWAALRRGSFSARLAQLSTLVVPLLVETGALTAGSQPGVAVALALVVYPLSLACWRFGLLDAVEAAAIRVARDLGALFPPPCGLSIGAPALAGLLAAVASRCVRLAAMVEALAHRLVAQLLAALGAVSVVIHPRLAASMVAGAAAPSAA